MKKKILLAEDDPNLGIILREFLEVKDFEVTLCVNGDDAFNEFSKNNFDLCILDIMMPKKDGFTLAKEIRKENDFIPIIFLTAKSMQHDKIEGLKIGADDYITKPFSTEELFLRLNAIFKRTESSGKLLKNNGNKSSLGKYIFNYELRLLKLNKKEQKLTTKEAELLKILCLNKNEVMERSGALISIWKEDNYFTARSMDVYITKLRGYLKEDSNLEIVNIHGTGYKLIEKN